MLRGRAKGRRGWAAVSLRLVALVAYGLSLFGMPMPARKGTPHDPFPCQDNACGCQTARQCWTSCHCYSPAERVRWAVRRGVPIPSYAVLPPADELARIVAESADAESGEAPERCCCCSKKHGAPAEAANGAVRVAVGSVVARCCGQSIDAVASCDVAPPPQCVTLPPLEAVDSAPILADQRPALRRDPPPLPPPRCSSF